MNLTSAASIARRKMHCGRNLALLDMAEPHTVCTWLCWLGKRPLSSPFLSRHTVHLASLGFCAAQTLFFSLALSLHLFSPHWFLVTKVGAWYRAFTNLPVLPCSQAHCLRSQLLMVKSAENIKKKFPDTVVHFDNNSYSLLLPLS